MPKMKTHRGAAKRFRVTGRGKLMRKHAYNGHLFTDKSAKRKHRLDSQSEVSPADDATMRKTLGVSKAR
ncbi:MAG: 50S ribosomal protein L35 [Candidatus Anoxymicrobium japonicum]|uniref:Large ribosomal subunit protein bL35 n=1 Tax=Candidatus Anoxymicrobium japonicum TaxID=2013648 RepID=A0A2N3G6Q4_9ACTN|nr:MAG: 50S ribosomal protein L35 [Candidatus Anoxymicrobium japonicum]